jgi:electron transfer flavoprotein alpha subunit
MNILAGVECQGGQVTTHSKEVLSAARQLAGESGRVTAVCVAVQPDDALADDLLVHGTDWVVLVEHEQLDLYPADAWTHELTALGAELRPEIILLPHTVWGAEIGPRVAFRLDGAAVTGCTGFQVTSDTVHVTRPCYGGSFRQVVTTRARPIVGTVAAKAFEPTVDARARVGRVEHRRAAIDTAKLRTQVTVKTVPAAGASNLESASIVVAGGRGVGGAAGFSLLSQLADTLGAAVGASRVACDLGWCPPSWQVGLSGHTVAPDVYFAVGISGAPQHLAGCANSRSIIAVNNDAEAEIFKFAHFGIVADCRDFLPALDGEVRKVRTASKASNNAS